MKTCPNCGGTVNEPLFPCFGSGKLYIGFHNLKEYCYKCGQVKNKPSSVVCTEPFHGPIPDRWTVYKSLDANYKSSMQKFAWPLPTTYGPGPWLEIEGEPLLCHKGFHGWLSKKKAFSDGSHVYEMEIEGKYVSDHEKACGTRARLVKEIFLMPSIPWEKYVQSEPSAFKIVEEAARIHADLRYTGTNEYGNAVTHNPCVPSFHEGELKPWIDHPNMCGTCGLNSELHDGWQGRHELSEKLVDFDRYELILYIQQLLNGKEPGLENA